MKGEPEQGVGQSGGIVWIDALDVEHQAGTALSAIAWSLASTTAVACVSMPTGTLLAP